MGKVLSIQFLRAVACLMVIQQHFVPFVPFTHHNVNGGFGVDLFFVISGYIIAASIERLDSTPFKTFVINRFSRIVPYYYFLTALLILLNILMHWKIDTDRIFHTITFTPKRNADPYNAMGWSLNHEIFFYFFTAICLLFTQNIKVIALLFFTFLSVLWFVPTKNYEIEFLRSSLNYTFLGGIIIFIYREHITSFLKNQWFLLAFSIIWILVIMLFTANAEVSDKGEIIYRQFGYFRDVDYFYHSHIAFPRFFVQGLPSIALFATVISKEAYFKNMSANFMIKIGNASFSIYLIQIFGLLATSLLGLYGLFKVSAVVVILLGVSLIFVKVENFVGNTSKRILSNFFNKKVSPI